MLPLKIGACLRIEEVQTYRDWLFDHERDIEIQNFMTLRSLTTDRDDLVAAAKTALNGHGGRVGMHAPFDGLDLHNKDPELRPLITARYVLALEAADAIGARQMVLHSPYDHFHQTNLLATAGNGLRMLERIQGVLAPVVARAEALGVTLVIENCRDPDPASRRRLVESFDSKAIAVSLDTGHAQLARRAAGAPPVDFFVRDAGAHLSHVHIQDVDGYADRHWAPGEGEIEWAAVFRALADCPSEPHLVLELRDKADIPKAFGYLHSMGAAC